VNDTLKRPQERFLGQVPSLLGVLSQPVKQPKDFAGTFIYECLERGCVATLQSFNELRLSLWPYIRYGRRSNLL
jgi:hypothetical protein